MPARRRRPLATLTGIDALVLSPGATPAALPLVGPALAAEVPVLALGEGARLLTEAAGTDGTGGGSADPLLGDGSAPHRFRVGASAWGLPVPDEADCELLRRFAELVAERAETTATRAFFTPRAAAWEERFAHQTPAYEAAVARMRLRPGQRALLFHPSGRAERAARHGRAVSPDDPLAEPNLRPALEAAGWHVATYEDATSHFLTRATR
ncbi:hypothetical protein [Streptomyces sp. NBC_00347]|uniref:hypothetical protein n=1 Tax=Streptomyces sp. NBC_00347 TaxID=2975721 RepID=UPI0022517795|nr:hypothetical protein [Streptomyces sp. NBC_00347]MCX5127983.1 hypothetical protein [Streptomyces sp. NBC_00347]